MSKVSVFKFNIMGDQQTINIINQIVGSYLNSRGFFYNNAKLCYTTSEPTKQDDRNVMVGNVAMAAASVALGSTFIHVKKRIQHGFELQINGNQLIIKAFLIDNRYNYKSYIHSFFNNSNAATYYYQDLKNNLFKKLKENNVVLVSREIEKINDGSEFKTIKILLIYFGVLILILGLGIFAVSVLG